MLGSAIVSSGHDVRQNHCSQQRRGPIGTSSPLNRPSQRDDERKRRWHRNGPLRRVECEIKGIGYGNLSFSPRLPMESSGSLVEADGGTSIELIWQVARAQEKAGYLDVVEVVRGRKWKIGTSRDNPLAWVAREAKRHFQEGEHGAHRGIVTAKGAHDGLRNPYREAESPIGEEAPRVRLRMALEVRLQNAPDYVPIAERFPPEYRRTYELSPEDSDEAKGVPFEKIALENGFDEFSVRALMYRVRGVSQKNAFEMEEEDHGKCTQTSVTERLAGS